MPKSKKDALLIALRKGQADKVARILDDARSADDPDVYADMDADSAKNSVLHRAARYDHLEVVKVLLDRGADPNRKNKFGMTPLHHASVAGAGEVCRVLVRAGARADRADDAGRTPLHWAAGHGFEEVVAVLLEEDEARPARADVADKEGWTPLHRCCQEKPPEKKKAEDDPEAEAEAEPDPSASRSEQDSLRADIARLLLRHGADADAREPKGYQRPLHLAAMNGYARTARVLIREGHANVDAVNRISQTPLMYAVVEEHADTVRTILECGRPDLTLANELHWEWAPAHWAAIKDNVEILSLLVEHGADLEIKDKVGRTPLKVADDHDKREAYKYLKDKTPSGGGYRSGAARRR